MVLESVKVVSMYAIVLTSVWRSLVSRGQPVFCRFRFAVTAKRKRQKTGWPRETRCSFEEQQLSVECSETPHRSLTPSLLAAKGFPAERE